VDLSETCPSGQAEAGLAILNRGLPEYEVLPDGGHNTIALTLLRCVGYLSRGEGDMPTRPGLAGPPLVTPEAQCQGLHTFEYAILPHPGDWRAMYRDAYNFRAPIYLRRGTECAGMTREGYVLSQVDGDRGGGDGLRPPDLSGDLPAALSFLTLRPEALVLSAVKRSEDGNSLIVRFYNPTSEPVEATLQTVYPIGSAQEVTLNEEPLARMTVDGEHQSDARPVPGCRPDTHRPRVGTTHGEDDASASRARSTAGQAVTVPIGGKQVKTIALQLEPMDIE
jgi:mannosylglycerate hydrolase